MQIEPPHYENRIVAFIDILAFSNFVSSLDAKPELHEKLFYALKYIKSFKNGFFSEDDAEVCVFSDSIVISVDQNSLYKVVWASGWLQAHLLGEGILLRGGISVGKTVHHYDILYGEGMLKAYKIEVSAAVYPRIVVDPCLISQANDRLKDTLLLEDFDGLWFVDPYSFCPYNPSIGNADELLADGNDPHEIYLSIVGEHIEKGLRLSNQVAHIAKWKWLELRHKSSVEEYLRTRETKFEKLIWSAEPVASADSQGRAIFDYTKQL